MQRTRELLFNWICVRVENKKEDRKSNNISVHMEISWKCARSHGSILMLDVCGRGCRTFPTYTNTAQMRSHYANSAYWTNTDTFNWHCKILLLCYCYPYSIRLHSRWMCHITAMQSARFPPAKICLSKWKFRQADKLTHTHMHLVYGRLRKWKKSLSIFVHLSWMCGVFSSFPRPIFFILCT